MKLAGRLLGILCLGLCLVTLVQSLGCAYALPVPTPPSHLRVKIAAKSPEVYVLRIVANRPMEYPVPADGRLTVAIPAYSRGCSVYLFNVMKVSNGYDPLNDWTAEIRVSGMHVRTVSLRQLIRLPTDSEGYRILQIKG